MRADVFRAPASFGIEEVDRPRIGPGCARSAPPTTICGTDLHIVRGGYPVEPGRIIGHELGHIVEEVGVGVTSAQVGTGSWWVRSPLQSVPGLLVRRRRAVWSRRGNAGARRLAAGEHPARRASGLRAHPVCAGEPGTDPREPLR